MGPERGVGRVGRVGSWGEGGGGGGDQRREAGVGVGGTLVHILLLGMMAMVTILCIQVTIIKTNENPVSQTTTMI